MLIKIELFLFILSVIFSLRFVIEFFVRFKDENPKPMEISKTNQVFLYLAISYIITYFLT